VSLRVRLALVVATTFAIVVVGCVYAAHVSARNELRAETEHFLENRARDPRITGERDNPFFPGRGPNRNEARPPFIEPDAVTQFLNADGKIVGAFEDLPPLPVDQRDKEIAAAGEGKRLRNATVDGEEYRVITVGLPGGGAAQIGRSIDEANDVLATLDVSLLLIALVGTAVAAALAWLIASRLVRPVERLTTAAEHVAATQDLSQQIDVEGRDELGRLAASFNTMLVALANSREQQQRLVLDASHELRTPLTALRTNIELLQRARDMDDAQRSELLDAALVELQELGDLSAEMVELATDARADEPLQEVNLATIAEAVVERQRRRTGRTITMTTDDPATLVVRAAALERAVGNLVDNACKFSPPDTAVDVIVDHARIDVRDRGPGITAEEREHVFDRFYRATTARTKPGSGLGLSIVKQIVEMHGGTVALIGLNEGGTIARIELPDGR
jgi:two-component system sensor histidine kinase MprB